MSQDLSKPEISALPDPAQQVRSGFTWLAWGMFFSWTIIALIAIAWACRRLSGLHKDFRKAGILCWILFFLSLAGFAVSAFIPPPIHLFSETRYFLSWFLKPLFLVSCAVIFLIILWLLVGALRDMSLTLSRNRLATMTRLARIFNAVLLLGGITVFAIREYFDLKDLWAYLHRARGWYIYSGPPDGWWRHSFVAFDTLLGPIGALLGIAVLIYTALVFENAAKRLVTSQEDVDKLLASVELFD